MKDFIKPFKIKYFILVFLISHLSFLIFPNVVHAQESSDSASSLSADQVYPGLLPDHPLYFLKITRDNVVGFFKGKPLEKADFALLQADKQFSATNILITQKNNPELAQMTLEGGQQYFEEAISQTTAAQKEGMDIHEMTIKLQQASKKHIVTLKEVKLALQEQDSKKYDDAKKHSEKLSQMTLALQP